MSRVIEEKILVKWENAKEGIFNLSKRDEVRVYADSTEVYRLWNTEIVRKTVNNEVFIFLSSSTSEDYQYYRYGRNNYPPISNTTRSRLNSFLYYYGFSLLYQKNWNIYFDGEKLEVDSWYKLDMENKKLVKMED